ncbi:MAG: dihydrofolate reductase [Candidatus Parcubacteria bacterium]|nr:dihydrofolate reductase [Candidatus Parcubacteria bacterium]
MKLKHKINYTAFMATSIDGRIACSSTSGIDWTSKEDSNFYQKSLTKMDVVIVGYNTYKLAGRRNWKDAVVLTSRVNSFKKIDSKTFFLNPQRSNLKKFLHNKNYAKVAIIGGGRVYDFCLRNKMIDKLFVTIEPYVFTTGISMFSGDIFKKYKFYLQSIKKLNNKGTILLKYKYKN